MGHDSEGSAAKKKKPNVLRRVFNLLKEPVFRRAFIAGVIAALMSGFAKAVNDGWVKGLDAYIPMAKEKFLKEILPDGYVFSCYMVTTTVIASFRTSFALSRFADAAGNIHEMGSSYFQAASFLFMFSRNSEADEADVLHFQETLIRMLSLLSALCLEDLEESAMEEISGAAAGSARNEKETHDFEVIDQECIDTWFQEFVHGATDTKPETVFESIQFLIMANTKNKVLDVPPPWIGTPLTHLSAGFTDYHDGLKMIYEKTPLAYKVMTICVLTATTTFVPLMMAVATRGPSGSMAISFGFVFAVWFMYGTADMLDNPYKKSSNVIHSETAQQEMNTNLLKLMSMRKHPIPTVDMELVERKRGSERGCSYHQTAELYGSKGYKAAGKPGRTSSGGGGRWSLPEFSFDFGGGGGSQAKQAPRARKAAPQKAPPVPPQDKPEPPPRPRKEPKLLSPSAKLQEISKLQQVANWSASGLLERHGVSPMSSPMQSPSVSPTASRRTTRDLETVGMPALPGIPWDGEGGGRELQILDGAASASSSPKAIKAH